MTTTSTNTHTLNGSAIYVIGIVVTAIFSLVAFIAIEVLRPGMDNALLYGQVFLFAGTIITGLFGSMKSSQAVAKVETLHEKVDVIEHKVDGINTAALANQKVVSEEIGRKQGVADMAQVAIVALQGAGPAIVVAPSGVVATVDSNQKRIEQEPAPPLLTQEVKPADPRYVKPSKKKK